MNRSRFHSLPLPVFLLFGVFWVSPVIAAQGQEDPFGSSVPVLGDVPEKVKAFLQRLGQENGQLRQENRDLKRHVQNLEDRFETKTKESAEARALLKDKNLMHQELFETLINSEDEKLQNLGLSHFMACVTAEGRDKLSLQSTPFEVARRLAQLTDSKNPKIRFKAASVISLFQNNAARNLGFQFSSVWRPVEQTKGNAEVRIYQALEEETSMDYEDCKLDEVVEDLKVRYRVGIMIDETVSKELEITYGSVQLRLFEVLGLMLDKHGLGFAVLDDQIVIMKSTDPRVRVEEIYNICGLRTDKLDVNGLVKTVRENFPEPAVTLKVIDENRIMMRASELDHRRIGKLLAKFSQPLNW